MTGTVAPLPPFTLVIDCWAPLGVGEPAKLLLAVPGAKVFARYLDNLSAAEIAEIHDAGAAILPVIAARTSGLSAVAGNALGQAMAAKAMVLGVPTHASVVCDLEGNIGSALVDVVADANECAQVLGRYGYTPGCYAGAPQQLTAGQLYGLPMWPYWRGGSVGMPEPGCGWAMVQLPPLDQTLAGHRVDISASCQDARGRTFMVWAPG